MGFSSIWVKVALPSGKDSEKKIDTNEVAKQDGKMKVLSELKKFTVKELEEYNRKDSKPVYIAYKGKVYDLSQSDLCDARAHIA
jgi:cytochrome b involved in lipid metabolism